MICCELKCYLYIYHYISRRVCVTCNENCHPHSVSIYLYINISVYIYIYTHVYISSYLYIILSIYIIYIDVYVYIFVYICVCLQWIIYNYICIYTTVYIYTHSSIYIWNSLPPTKSPDFPRALRWFWPLLPSVARGSVPCWRCSIWSVSGHSQRRGWNGWNPWMGDLQWNYMNFCGIWFT